MATNGMVLTGKEETRTGEDRSCLGLTHPLTHKIIHSTWQSPNPRCHQTADAYGNVVARQLKSSLLKLACSGSTFWNGIVTGHHKNAIILSADAQFGNYDSGDSLNSYYEGARPDVVIVTLGADDLSFSAIVRFCLENALLTTWCTINNPGPDIQDGFYAPINNGSYVENFRTLINWIQARGRDAGKIPRIVMTTYGNPLPPDNVTCPDTLLLRSENIAMLNELSAEQYRRQLEAWTNIPGVWIADLSQVFNGHTWCNGALTDEAPWAYGMSVVPAHPRSSAPFHPTPRGQLAMADIITQTVVNAMRSCDSLVCEDGKRPVFDVPDCLCP